MKIYFCAAVAAAAVLFSGCSSHKWWPDVDSQEECRKLQVEGQKFEQVGHISTAHIIGITAGLGPYIAERYALFSQAPDQLVMKYAAIPVSIWGTLLPWELQYRHDVTAVLHSLHGGGPEEVQKRRDRLEAIAKEYVERNDRKEDWKTGFIIHALGDSYAHTYRYEGEGTYAYGQWTGHLCRRGLYHPDSIKENLDNYLGYIDALYRVYNTGMGDEEAFRRFRSFVKDAAAKPIDDEQINKLIDDYNIGMMSKINYCEHEIWAEAIDYQNVKGFLEQLRAELES